MNKIFSMISANKNRLGVLLLLMSVAVFVSEYDWQMVKTKTYLPIEDIKIEGRFENLMQADIQKTVKSVLHGGYFTVDIGAIQHALMGLPWVEEVSVRRQWPAGLNISVTEKQAIARWGENRLISDKGTVFSPDAVLLDTTIPYLDGPDNLHKIVWFFLKDTNKKIKKLDVVVKRLVLDKRRSWEMQLSNNLIVKLGRESTENRLQRFIKVFSLDEAPKMQNIESIDLRYPNGFAMRMKITKPDLRTSTPVKEV